MDGTHCAVAQRFVKPVWAFLLFVGLLGAPHWLCAGVTDGGRFFQEETVAEANRLLAPIEQKAKLPIVIDTFAMPPADLGLEPKAEAAKRNQLGEKWAIERAKAQNAGIYILICKEPTLLRTVSGKSAAKAGFDSQEQAQLRDLLISDFKSKDFDAGLLKAVRFIEESLQTPATEPSKATAKQKNEAQNGNQQTNTEQEGGIGGYILIGLLILVVLIVVMAMGSGGGGGGGFFSGLFGGLFGAMAGMWLYDSFFGDSSNTDAGADGSAGEDYTSSGGDFGDGGDFGGDGDF